VKVLLVAQAFPPFNASGAVRVGALAKYLAARGDDVRVLTASPLPYPRTLQSPLESDRIVRTASFDPLTLLAWARRRRAAPARASARGSATPGRLLRSFAAFVTIPEPQFGWFFPAVRAGRRLLRTWKPDVIYASALPFTAHIVAAWLAQREGVPWIAEFRDHFAGNPYSNLPSWRVPIDRWIERQVIASASACVTVSEPMAETLRALHEKPTVAALNGFEEPVDDVPNEPSFGPLRIVYTGLIYPGRRDPSPLFEAIASLGPDAARIEVAFFGQDLRGVVEAAARHGVSDVVRVGGAIPHCDALAEQRKADVLLLLLWNDPREAGVYTGKLFEYVGAGRPILAVGGDGGAAARLVRERGLGVSASDPVAIAKALVGWIAQKRATGVVAGPAERARVGLSRGDQFAIVHDLVRRTVRGTLAASA
jgi:glycosyltransferase involved in cell wall biosynthesis